MMGRVDILTGTLGKALGGAIGRLHGGPQPRSSTGCASARGPIFLQHPGAGDRGGLAQGAGPARAAASELRAAAAATTPRYFRSG